MDYFYDILKQLVRTPSVVGAEHNFFMYCKRELEEIGVSVEYYDGVLVATGNEPTSGYISAHADRHGLICTGHNEFQYAAFIAKNRADLTGNSNSEQLLNSLSDRFLEQKVQAYEPWSGSYLGMGIIKEALLCPRRNNIIFKVDGFDYLFPGTPIAFMDKITIKDNLVSGQLDNVLTVAIVIYLYHLGYQGTAFFTASEEAGKSWRFLLEWFRRFDVSTNKLLVLDTSPYESLEDILNIDVVLRNRDSNAVFRSPLKAKIKKIAKENKIRFQYKDLYIKAKKEALGIKKYSVGTTELGRIIDATKGEIQGTTMQIPTIGYHTIEETAHMGSIDSMIKILSQLYIKNPIKLDE
jgi:putative aminopeptidase FrvX